MSYLETFLTGRNNSNLLENLYRQAQQEDKTGAYLWQADLVGVDLTGAEIYEAVMPDEASHE